MLEMEDRLGQICKALSFAAQKHTRQRRKDTEASPYINHPICLLDTLVNEGKGPIGLTAGELAEAIRTLRNHARSEDYVTTLTCSAKP